MNRPEIPGSNDRGLSNGLWSKMPLDVILNHKNAGIGVGLFDDFTEFGGSLSTSDGHYVSEGNVYRSYQTASTFIKGVAMTPTPASVAPTNVGAIILSPTSGVADNDIMTLVRGGQVATPYGIFPFSLIPGISQDLVFEARFKISSVAASIGNFFIGLAGAAGVDTASADCPIAADVLATTLSMVGFGKFGASTTPMGLFYERASGTVATKAAVGTLAADTYIKAGFRWDGNLRTLTPWINGVEVPSLACGRSITGATPWPNDYMTPVVSVRQIDGTTACELTLDWWACAQLLG